MPSLQQELARVRAELHFVSALSLLPDAKRIIALLVYKTMRREAAREPAYVDHDALRHGIVVYSWRATGRTLPGRTSHERSLAMDESQFTRNMFMSHDEQFQYVAKESGGWLLEDAVATEADSMNQDPLQVLCTLEDMAERDGLAAAQLYHRDLHTHSRK